MAECTLEEMFDLPTEHPATPKPVTENKSTVQQSTKIVVQKTSVWEMRGGWITSTFLAIALFCFVINLQDLLVFASINALAVFMWLLIIWETKPKRLKEKL